MIINQQPTLVSHDASNNASLHNHQQSTSNIASPPPQHADQNPFFLPLNSLSITINSPQTYVIVMPAATNSDTQNQLQQIHAYLNQINSQTRT